jgi:hypothetical protein
MEQFYETSKNLIKMKMQGEDKIPLLLLWFHVEIYTPSNNFMQSINRHG